MYVIMLSVLGESSEELRVGAYPDVEQRRKRAAARYRPADPAAHAGLIGAARVLAHFLDVPIAAVGLVEGCRLRLAPGVGHRLDHLPRTWARVDDVLDGATVVVPDTEHADHFIPSPLPVAAWAGAPIRTPDGEVIGAVIVADHQARAFPPIQVELLNAMAGLVMAELAARRTYVSIPAERQFEWLLRDASDSVAVLDPDGRVAWLSPALQQVLGYDHPTAIQAVELIHLDDMPLVVGSITVALARPGISGPVEFRMAHQNRSWRTMEAVFSNCLDNAAVGGVVVYLRDVTERQRHADVLAAEARVLTSIARRAPLTDVLRGIIELVEGSLPGARVAIDSSVSGGLIVIRPDGRPHTPGEEQVLAVASSLVSLAFERHEPAGADTPPTGIVGREELLRRIERVIERSTLRGGKVAVLLLDLDRFNDVNLCHGHDVGDRVLPLVARRVLDAVRPKDIVVRSAGDEFVVVCDGVVGELEAVGVAERINLALFEPIHVDRAEVRVTASIGIAMTHGDDDHAEALLRDADAALYLAKHRGRGRFEVFSETRRRELRARRQLDSELEQALDEGELRVWLQPEIELPSGRVIGFEALVRWEHPERGLLAPGEFIPQAERSGLIDRVGGWVLEEACRLGRRYRDAHEGAPFVVAVNLSARQLTDPTLTARVTAALEDSGLQPDELCLELTESALMDDADLSLIALRALKALGVRLAIDDFGTGYSSLSYLRRFPIDAVKIDRSFVSGLGSRAEDAAIVTAVLTLARALGLSAIAEGVEQTGQRDELIRLGCIAAQGFLFSPPRPAEELLRI